MCMTETQCYVPEHVNDVDMQKRTKTAHMLITNISKYSSIPLYNDHLPSLSLMLFSLLPALSGELNIRREKPLCSSEAKQRLSKDVIFFLLSFSLADCVMLMVIGPSLRGSHQSLHHICARFAV